MLNLCAGQQRNAFETVLFTKSKRDEFYQEKQIEIRIKLFVWRENIFNYTTYTRTIIGLCLLCTSLI